MNRLRDIRFSPSEGWLSLVLLIAMALIVGWAIDEPNWVIGSQSLTDFLPWAAVGGVLAGFITAELGWRRLRAHFAGAVAAALVVPVIVGSVLVPDEGDFLVLFQSAAEASVHAVIDLIVKGRGSTMEYGHFLLVLGLLLWATGQFAGYAVFGHRRAMPAVVALGMVLLVNMALAPTDQLWLLVAFSLAALLLLVRMHSLDERGEWLRRRIGDPGPLAGLTARAGAVFVAVAVVGALALTTTAKSEPLSGAWTGAEGWLVDTGRSLSRYFTFLGNPRGPAIVDFGPSADIGTKWSTDGRIAVEVVVPAGDEEAYYWRAATYDLFTGQGWATTDEEQQPRAADAAILEGTLESSLAPITDPAGEGQRTVVFKVVPDAYRGFQVLGPNAVVAVSTATRLNLSGAAGFMSSIELPDRGREYTVTSVLPLTGDEHPLALTANKLRAAGTDYPTEIRARYLRPNPAGVVGPEARRILALVEAMAQTDAAGRGEIRTPYDLAFAMVELMHDPAQFDYAADISDLDCGGRDVVECFSFLRKGFCQYYASTAAVLLREAGVPTRFVQGFLPGERAADGSETVRNSGAHAWIEVYFPGYGWVMFDPTGGGLADNAPLLPPGEPVVRPSPTPRASPGSDDGQDPRRSMPSIGPGGSATGGPGGPGVAPFVAVGLLLAAAVGWLAFSAYRRGPREVTPDSAWRSVTGTARRLGFGPRPTQTVFEYSAALGEVLPAVRPELETVARAKVETAYGRAQLGADRLRAVRSATGRLRVGLLRLALRRGPFRRR